jgi:hypothetical protein
MDYATKQKFNSGTCDNMGDLFIRKVLAKSLINEMSLEDLEKLFSFTELGVSDYDPEDYPGMTAETIEKIRSCYEEYAAAITI